MDYSGYIVFETVPLCSSGCPEARSVDSAGLKFSDMECWLDYSYPPPLKNSSDLAAAAVVEPTKCAMLALNSGPSVSPPEC